MRSRPLRVAVVVVGLVLVVYGVANVTGGWLGTPPWLERPVVDYGQVLSDWIHEESDRADFNRREVPSSPDAKARLEALHSEARSRREPTAFRSGISVGLTALGLALVAFAAWPRRATPRRTLPR